MHRNQNPRRRTRRPCRFVVRRLWTLLALVSALAAPRANAFVPPWIATPGAESNATSRARVLASPNLGADPSQAENRDDFDVLRYQLTLYPDFADEALTGDVSITLRSLVNGLGYADLDLYDALTVYDVIQGNNHLDITHQNDVLRVVFATPLNQNGTISFTVRYGGKVAPAGFMGFDYKQSPAGNPVLATLSEPYYARSWWPCKDTPDDKAEMILSVLAPEGMFAASNGRLVGQVPIGSSTMFTWVESYPITTYNVSLAVADYVSWTEDYVSPGGESMTLEYHVFPEHETAARFDFGRTSQIMDYYAGLFGEYPFIEEKYGTAEFVWDGAMEHQTMTSYGDFFLTGDRFYERIIGHELSHQWWGNSLTATDWNDLWIHEGFATYCEGLWKEYLEGPQGMRDFLRPRSNACCGFIGPIVPPAKLFNDTVYNKAAWMLHMLRRLLGDGAFFDAARDLASRPDLQYGGVTTEDVIQQFETSTSMPLRWFFDQWLYRDDRPTLDLQWSSTPSQWGALVTIRVDQVQDGAPYTFPLDLRIQTPEGDTDVELWMTSTSATTQAWVPSSPTGVLLDPDGWLLHFVPEDPQPTATPSPFRAARLLPNVPNPFNPRTSLRFELAHPGRVALRILDTRGRVVDVLDPGPLEAGQHGLEWDGRDADGHPVASGVYRVILEAEDGATPARPITLVR